MNPSTNPPATVQTEAARAGRLRSAALWGMLFQGVYAFWQFAVLKMLYPYLGVERFGLWVTVFSLTLWTTLANVGIHQAMLTHVGRFGTRGGGHRVNRTAWVATAVVGGIGLIVTLGLLTLGWAIPWGTLLNVQGGDALTDTTPTVIVALCLGLIALPALMGAIVVQGRQLGGMRYAVACVVQLIDLLLVWIGIRSGWSLPTLAAIMMAPPIVTGLLLWILARRHGLVRPRPPRAAMGMHVKALLRLGSGYFVLELAGLLILQAGYLIVVHRVGLEAVVVYAAIYRLIGLLLACSLVISQAYWPTFSEAWQHGERAWPGRALRQMFIITALLWSAAAVGITLIGPAFIEWWLGVEARPSMPVVITALLFAAAQMLLVAVETPLRGFGRTRTIVTAALIGGVLLLPLGILGAGLFGVPGVFAAQALASGIALSLNASALYNLFMSKAQRQSVMPGILRRTHSLIARTPIARWIAPLQIAKRIRSRRDKRILQAGWYDITLCGQPMRFPVTTNTHIISLDDALSEEQFLTRLLDSLQLNDVVYDIGANLGVVSILLARQSAATEVRIEAFEPIPDNIAMLRDNLGRHDADQVIVHPLALGATAGRVTLDIEGNQFEVPVSPGQDIASASGHPPTVLKIDVEGAELDVLRGVVSLLDQQTVRELFIELHPGFMAQRGDSQQSLDTFLTQRGYRLVWSKQRNLETHLHYRAAEVQP